MDLYIATTSYIDNRCFIQHIQPKNLGVDKAYDKGRVSPNIRGCNGFLQLIINLYINKEEKLKREELSATLV